MRHLKRDGDGGCVSQDGRLALRLQHSAGAGTGANVGAGAEPDDVRWSMRSTLR